MINLKTGKMGTCTDDSRIFRNTGDEDTAKLFLLKCVVLDPNINFNQPQTLSPPPPPTCSGPSQPPTRDVKKSTENI